MQKKNIVIKNNKGIALITLIVAVLMMLVISSMIIYNSLSFLNMSNLNKMYNDIKLLNEQVILYSGVNRNLPILDNAYTAELDASITDGFNKDNFYVLDLNRMNKNLKNSLSFGKDYYSSNFSGKDIYVINKLTYQIFYVKGMKYDNTTYYTVPGKDNYTQITDNLIANPPVLEEGYKSVIWENNAVKEINKYDEKWYNYTNSTDLSSWARAQKELDSKLYMWVPRYIYNTDTKEIVFLKGNTNIPIDNKKDTTSQKWQIPEAFKNKENEQLTGIWLDLNNNYNSINTNENLINAVNLLTAKG